MRTIKQSRPKHRYYIIHGGQKVGESWAVSPEKARTNFWWRNVKGENEFSHREYNPEDFDVVEA